MSKHVLVADDIMGAETPGSRKCSWHHLLGTGSAAAFPETGLCTAVWQVNVMLLFIRAY